MYQLIDKLILWKTEKQVFAKHAFSEVCNYAAVSMNNFTFSWLIEDRK